jgi:predicted ABC-type ATPase
VKETKQLWLLVGGNGAGKSTFYQTRLQPLGLPFINADMIAKELYPDAPEEHSYDAASIAEEMRYRLLQEGRSFCFETVFSHPSKIDFVAHAKTLGYQVILIFIHLESVGLNKARILQRLESGGHNVPDEKVEQRIPRLLKHIKTVIPLCDHVRILDNPSARNPFMPVMIIRDGVMDVQQSNVPEWAEEFFM